MTFRSRVFETRASASSATPAHDMLKKIVVEEKMVEQRGIEPLTSTMPLWRSPN